VRGKQPRSQRAPLAVSQSPYKQHHDWVVVAQPNLCKQLKKKDGESFREKIEFRANVCKKSQQNLHVSKKYSCTRFSLKKFRVLGGETDL